MRNIDLSKHKRNLEGLKVQDKEKKGKHNHKKGATHRTISLTNNGSSLRELENCSSVEQQHGRENGGEEIYDNETTEDNSSSNFEFYLKSCETKRKESKAKLDKYKVIEGDITPKIGSPFNYRSWKIL
jgi:hypothetical protein